MMTPQEKARIKNDILVYIANNRDPQIDGIAEAVDLDVTTTGLLVLELKAEKRILMTKKPG